MFYWRQNHQNDDQIQKFITYCPLIIHEHLEPYTTAEGCLSCHSTPSSITRFVQKSYHNERILCQRYKAFDDHETPDRTERH